MTPVAVRVEVLAIVFSLSVIAVGVGDALLLFGSDTPKGALSLAWSLVDVRTNDDQCHMPCLATSSIGAPHTNAGSAPRPSARGRHSMVYDPESDRVILYGGASDFFTVDLNETWAYNVAGNEWRELQPPVAPPLGLSTMAYDVRSDRAVMYHQQGQTWAYDYNNITWTNLLPITAPPAPGGDRRGAAMAYDFQSDRIIFFGGRQDDTAFHFNDTWAYDLETNRWSQMHPAISPPGRLNPGMVYDSVFDRVVLFGGAVGGSRLNDTWAYDYNNDTWTSLNPATAPSPRGATGMVYDSDAGLVILFGGVGPVATGEIVNNETWTYDYATNNWARLGPSRSPGPRAWHAMVYENSSKRTILFGGGPSRTTFTRETWTYDFGANAWTLVDAPTPPVASFSFSPTSPVAGEALTFDASGSSDADGSIVSFAWRFGDGATTSGQTAQHAYASANTYSVALTITDNDGLESGTTRQVVVSEAPDTINPSIVFTSPDDGATLTSRDVTVAGTASDDGGVEKVELRLDDANWVLATGTISWTGTLTLSEGPNTIHARATDTSGNVNSTSVSVTVSLPPPPPPTWPLIAGVVAAVSVGAIIGALLWRRKGVHRTPPRE